MRWRQFLSYLLCATLLSGSVSGARLHLCGHGDKLQASLQVHTPHHLDLHLADKEGAGDLDIDLLAGMLQKVEPLGPGAAAPALALLWLYRPDIASLSWPSGAPPGLVGRRPLILPPLRAPPHSLPA